MSITATVWGAGPVGSGAEAYYAETLRMLHQVETELPQLTATAEQAAKLYVSEERRGIGADGQLAFYAEAQGRAGGIMGLMAWGLWDRREKWQGIVLYCLREDGLDQDLPRVAEYRRGGSMVIGFGNRALLAAARQKGLACEATIEVPAAPHGGLLPGKSSGSWVVPTYELGAIVTLWPWVGEFVGACTRLGKMPAMFQSYDVPGSQERAKRYVVPAFNSDLSLPGAYAKWHESAVPPVAAGTLGRAWVTAVRERLELIQRHDLRAIRAAAQRAAQARARGGHLYAVVNGHALAPLFGGPHDPRYFRDITTTWNNPAAPVTLTTNDFVLGVGYSSIFNGDAEHHFADHVRQAGTPAAWIAATYRPERVRTLPGEIFIDAHWEEGDAAVAVPGYDIRILPPSGALVGAIYFMINAEVAQIEDAVARK